LLAADYSYRKVRQIIEENYLGVNMKKLIFILGVLMMASFANAKSIVVYYSKTGEQVALRCNA